MDDQEKLREGSIVLVANKRGRVYAKYKAGATVVDSRGGRYEVQGDGSWRKIEG